MEQEFIKNNPTDKIWWVDNPDVKGEFLFSFDKEKVFNLFADYPWKLTKEQRRIFDKENPYWADFFKDRKQLLNPATNTLFLLGCVGIDVAKHLFKVLVFCKL